MVCSNFTNAGTESRMEVRQDSQNTLHGICSRPTCYSPTVASNARKLVFQSIRIRLDEILMSRSLAFMMQLLAVRPTWYSARFRIDSAEYRKRRRMPGARV